MRRWISSAGMTVILLLLAFLGANWISQNSRHLQSEQAQPADISVVSIVRRHRAKPKEEIKPKISPRQASQTIPKPLEESAGEVTEEDSEESDDEIADSDSAETDAGLESAGEQAEAAPQAESYGVSEEMEKSYKSYALSRIAGKKKYPYKARSLGQQGKVRMRIVIEPDGTLSEAGFVQESEFALLNEASLAAVRKSAPFKKMPHGMRRQEYVFAIDYSLE